MVSTEESYKSTTVEFLEEKGANGGKENGKTSLFLYFSALTASMMSFGMGSIVVWTSPTVSRLRMNDTAVNPLGTPITTFQESMLGGLLFIGTCIGSLFLTKLCDVIGRHKSLLLLTSFMLVADIVLAFASKLYIYYICRLVLSISMGGGLPILSIYLSEITENHNRGRIGTFLGLSFPMGNLYVYIVGPILSIRNFTLLCALPYVILVTSIIFFIPESPVYLASKGKRVEAIKSLEKLRDKTPVEIEKDYELIIRTWNHADDDNKGTFKDFITNKGLRKGLIIAVAANIFTQLSGVAAILAFAGPLCDAAEMNISGNTTGILIGIIKLSSVFLATVIIQKVGNRPLFLISSFGSSISHFFLGFFFYLQSIEVAWISKILWLPVASVLMYFVFYGVGLGALTPFLTSELFPSNVKSIPVAFASFTNFMVGFVIISIFPIFVRSLGPTWCLWGFSLCSFFGFVFFYFLLPELKGKSVIEIMEVLSK